VSEYTRTTRECAFGELRPELVAVIRHYIAKHKLDHAESEVLLCCETTSQRQKRGLFGRRTGGGTETQYSGVLVTPTWLIWATSDPKFGTAAISARLVDIEVKDYDSTLLPDEGLDIFGFLTDAAERGSIFLGLGRDPAAQKLKHVLREALASARVAPRPALT
jgi:hypothetical protein